MVDQITTAEWRAVLLHVTAVTPAEERAAAEALVDAAGSHTRALAVLAEVRRLEAVTTVPAVDIAFAGIKPPPAADADPPGRLRPVVTISTRPSCTLPSSTQRRPVATPDRRCTLAAPVSSPERSSGTQRPPGRESGGRGELVAGWVVAVGALLVPVLVAVQMWRGAR